MKFKGSFGEWLQERRKALDLTQRDVAYQAGCAEVTIRKIEANVGRPSKQVAERLADVLAIVPEDRVAFLSFARRLPIQPPAVPVEADSPQPPLHNLPAAATPFVGRERELLDIARDLADPSCRLLTLLGPGGIGKTRLALQSAADQVALFEHGVYYVPLTAVGSSQLIAPALASVLEITLSGKDNPTVQMVHYLRNKRLLLIMDNYEHLLDGVGLLSDILTHAPRVKIVVTSRERLNLQEEWSLPVGGLSFPDQDANTALESFSAVQLFVQSARRVQPDFSLEDNRSGVIDICQAVEGMPLALELAATWLRAMPCQQIAGQIRRNLDFLATPLRNMPERHRRMRAVFDHSWNLLAPGERSVLMKLSVFRGGYDAEAAQQVAGATLSILADLIDKSLIRVDSGGRYDLHELVRQYAGGQLRDGGDENSALKSHFDYFLCLAEGAEAHNFGRDQVAWFDKLEIELDNSRSALDWSIDTESGLRLAAALGWFFAERGHRYEGYTWLERALAANQAAPNALRAKALHHAAACACFAGAPQVSTMLCEQALDLGRATNDPWNIAWAGSQMVQYGRPPLDQAVALLDESLALFRQLGDQMGIVHTLIRRGWLMDIREDYAPVRRLVEEAARRAEHAGDRIMMGWAYYDLGRLAKLEAHNLQQARAYLVKSRAMFREARFADYPAMVWLAEVERDTGNLASARSLYEEYLVCMQALTPINRLTDRPHIARVWAALADISRADGLFERAARLLGAVDSSALICNAFFDDTWNITYNDDLQAVRNHLGEVRFAEVFAEGKAFTVDELITYALEGKTAAAI